MRKINLLVQLAIGWGGGGLTPTAGEVAEWLGGGAFHHKENLNKINQGTICITF